MTAEFSRAQVTDATLTTIDGSSVAVSVPQDHGFAPALVTSWSVFGFPDGSSLMFRAGSRDFGVLKAEHAEVEFQEEYSPLATGSSTASGAPGRFRFGEFIREVEQVDVREVLSFGIWQGEVASVISELVVDCCSGLLELFNYFAFRESHLGAWMVPLPTRSAFVHSESPLAPRLNIHLEGFGSIAIVERTEEQEWRVPRWAGHDVRGGELFADAAEDRDPDTPPVLSLITDTAVAQIEPQEWEQESAALEIGSQLTVEWSAASA